MKRTSTTPSLLRSPFIAGLLAPFLLSGCTWVSEADLVERLSAGKTDDTGVSSHDADGDGFTMEDGDCWDNPDVIPPAFTVVPSTLQDRLGQPLSWVQPTAAEVHPGAIETWYDGIDQDCGGEDDLDQDDDSYRTDAYPDAAGDFGVDCFDGTTLDAGSPTGKSPQDVSPIAVEVWYDGTDDNCDGSDCDQDRDGHDAGAEVSEGVCGGDDCDDQENSVNPSAVEVWYDGLDQDCDGDDCDQDDDGHLANEGACDGDDCDDLHDDAFPGGIELWYDGVDQDCDGNDCDQDLDGYCISTYEHAIPEGFAEGDCDEANPEIHPGVVEIWYDNVDQDCDGNDCDQDGDAWCDAAYPFAIPEGYGMGDCNEYDASIYPTATETAGDGMDQDCDGLETCLDDLDMDGYASSSGGTHLSTSFACDLPGDASYWYPTTDCDDTDSSISPGVWDTPADGLDQNCDGGDNCYPDYDGDGYGYGGDVIVSSDLDCEDANESTNSDDCLDSGTGAEHAFPGAAPFDSKTACMLDADGDDYGSSSAPGWGSAGQDCDDSDSAVRPGATEITADGVDQNCDGVETCYQDLDNDRYGSTTTIASTDMDCSDLRESRYNTDCLDTGTYAAWAFPGSALLESSTLCMMDYDGDNWGSTTAPGTGTAGRDCNDSSSLVRPGATEIPVDGVDQDCDSTELCYADLDLDGYAGADTGYSTSLVCSEDGFSLTISDCDDADATVSPGVGADDESSLLVDNDCDGLIDEDAVSYGSIVITEVNKNSTAGGTGTSRNPDANWFEVYNVETFDISLTGWVISTCDATGFSPPYIPDWAESCTTYQVAVSPEADLVVPAGGFAVLCQDSTIGTLTSECDYDYGGLYTGSDTSGVPYGTDFLGFESLNGIIQLSLESSTVDEVGWYYYTAADGWPNVARHSLCLQSGFEDAVLNDNMSYWGSSITDIWATSPSTNYGTPGAVNDCAE